MRSCRAAAPRPASLLARLILGSSLLAGLAVPALVTPILGPAVPAAAAAAARPPAAVTITSVSPAYARPGEKIRVSGVLRNTSSAPVRAITIQLRSSSQAITDRDDLGNYAAGSGPSDVLEPGALARIAGPVPAGASVPWSAVLPVNEVHMSVFGVYPLAAEAATSAVTLGTSRTFLPFWPTGHGAVQPREDIAWIWPLIDEPDQGPCPGLLNNRLAASLSSGGRLADLLSAGSSAAGQQAKLTWVVDPALLGSAQVMAGPGSYLTGASAACAPATTHAASAPAAEWLSRLRSAVAGQPAVATPYADVDIAGLVQQNLDGDVHRAFADGRGLASSVLKQDFTPPAAAGPPSAAALTSALAWPADGLANYPMLETLAAVDGIKTVVLSSAAMPPLENLSYTPSAVTTTPDGEGGDMRVLLADSTLTQILGSVTAQSDPVGASFAAQQMFLAQTAMIAAESPHLSRAVVVAPPRRWDPPAGLASGLLADTASAPWLAPVSAGSLAADQKATGQVARQAPGAVGPHLTGRSLLRGAAVADQRAALVQSLRVRPAPRLTQAVAAIESSAWRGSAAGQQQARAMLSRVLTYLNAQAAQVTIVEPGRDTLGGQTGPIPISIDNKLKYPVRVKVKFTVSQDRGGDFAVLSQPGLITVPAETIITKKVKVKASSIGSTTVSLQLLAPDGQPLPAPPVNMTVQSTQLGTVTLVVLAAALAVFMIASASRAIRRGRSSGGAAGGGAPDGPGPGAPGEARRDASDHSAGSAGRHGDHEPDRGSDHDDHEPDRAAGSAVSGQARRVAGPGTTNATGRGGHEQAEETDNVGHDRAAPTPAGTDLAATEDADDYARVPGWADRR
ncbi:MAG TPA: DUF6049 family protein [Streptosporangiaceae bacterium]|nr:DUF6049 family protein [Streptosporangiaceae bacterium]